MRIGVAMVLRIEALGVLRGLIARRGNRNKNESGRRGNKGTINIHTHTHSAKKGGYLPLRN